MKFTDYNSLDEIPEKEFMKLIFSNQLQIIRKLSFIEHELRKQTSDSEVQEYDSLLNQFVQKTDTSLKNIEKYLNSKE